MAEWAPDDLGDGYEQHVIALGPDPDGEGDVQAVLVRRVPQSGESVDGAMIYVHGFSDYFFQTAMADFYAERGLAFYALDLRKCGRSRLEGQTGHYVSDLALYDLELGKALAIVREETGGLPVVLSAHSTGGLVLPLWLDRLNRQHGGTTGAGVVGLILNSPWFDLQGKALVRTVGTQAFRALARVQPFKVVSLPPSDAYGTSLHVSGHGEWEFNTTYKPLNGFPVTFGWINAIRRGHAALHKGLDVGVPSLVMRSSGTKLARAWSPAVDRVDAVLDVDQIARWAGCLGNAVTSLPVEGARHDVFLSEEDARAAAYAAVDQWLTAHQLVSA